MNIWLVVALSVAVVLGCILVLRLHAFLTLLLAGLLVAAISGRGAVERYTQYQLENDKISVEQAEKLNGQSPVVRLTTAFGQTAGKIGILIALASVIGQCLLESGAAAVIVDRMLKLTGPKRAPEALAASSFVLGIPVFFDTVFYLMVPLARSLRQRLGKDYVLFILAILAGGSIAHSLVPPTPGPLLVAGIIGVDIATMMLAGLVIGGCSSVLSLAAARLINRLVDVPLRPLGEEDAGPDEANQPAGVPPSAAVGETEQASQADSSAAEGAHSVDTGIATAEPVTTPDSTTLDSTTLDSTTIGTSPSLFAALLPIALPVLLIGLGSAIRFMTESGTLSSSGIVDILASLGDKNIALGIGVVFALTLKKYCPAAKRSSVVSRSLAAGGNIILITAAGGAFGAMLRQAGIEQAVGALAHGVPGIMILPLAFVVTASIRTLQGSATVAMITAAGVLQGFAQPETLPFHPVYLAMAIGAGSKPVSWMTDSAFWVITRMSGMTEAEGLRVISPMSLCLGFSALLFTMLFAVFFPFA
ncbi:MAG: GntP family permease [Rubripirellula sp.]|nr:GntP family permease [Rubripirellula sp.]